MALELQKKLDCKDLYNFLTNLGSSSLEGLYDSPHASLAVLRYCKLAPQIIFNDYF